ncbi:MAG: hypothetical protein Q8Q48_02665 [Candidatus Staskawiczbacteria bacterium]|nr:hypothetical protein [Candidatus Staskawiczbacteria bacterium]
MITKDSLLLGIAIGAVILASGLIVVGQEDSPFNLKTIPDSKISIAPEQAIPAKEMTCADINKTDKPQFEAYVVSQCPFGLQMQRSLAEIVKSDTALSNQIKVRYIGTISNGQLSSMHGAVEAQENLRQICIREEENNKYWDYISCHIKKGDVDSCLSLVRISKNEVDACMKDPSRGIKYAQEDADLAAKYKIVGSPTLIINGQEVSEYNFGGRNPNAVKDVLCCGFNDMPTACSVQLNKTDPATAYSETYLKAPKK